MSFDVPLAIHLGVLALLLVALLQREIFRIMPATGWARPLRRLDATVVPLLVVFAALAASRLAELL